MNTIVRKEIEELIVGGRRKTIEEFDRMIEKYLLQKAEKDKKDICEALADFYSGRLHQYVNIENELAALRQSEIVKQTGKMFEMA